MKGDTAMSAQTLESRPSNRLIHETSPYLQQHAHNPVDWYPWSDQAFDRARLEDKPLFLSIGYSTCHWCHVMERESFEDEATAQIMNEHFVCIKVDREERPDIDAIYMDSVQLMTGSGGWPLSVFATPEGKPFYGGTYFPPEDLLGRPGFRRLLQTIADAWRHRREDLLESGESLLQALAVPKDKGPGDLSEGLIQGVYASLVPLFDSRYAGFGSAPKFPQTSILILLMHYGRRTGEAKALNMVTQTLDAMAAGGIYDHLGGGFHRYATDAQWQVPHFEKMLYDQALLAAAYARAYQITKRPAYALTVSQVLDYVLRDMTDPNGGFYSAEDADSEGREGTFYLWTPEQIAAVLDETGQSLVFARYGVTKQGNFEAGTSILHIRESIDAVANRFGMESAEAERLLEQARSRLLKARVGRVRPQRDDKIITAWNGLMISSLATGGAVLNEDRYIEAAIRAADDALHQLYNQGRLMHSRTGTRISGPGFLDDYAFLAAGLLDLYDTTFVPRWLAEAKRLAEQMIDLFDDTQGGAFFFTGKDAEPLIVRTKPDYDGALPNANSVAALVLLKLGHLTMDRHLTAKATAILESFGPVMATSPMAATAMMTALDFHLGPTREITLAGDRDNPVTRQMIQAIHSRFLPHTLTVLRPAGSSPGAIAELVPFTRQQPAINGRPTAYVCEGYTCNRPLQTVPELVHLLSLRP
jgi:uncharacterized protein